MRPNATEGTIRVLIETLRLSRLANPVELSDIAANAGTTEFFARKVLLDALGETGDEQIFLSPKIRVRLALEVARAGRLRDAAQVLNWREFEAFGGECLQEAEFRTERNVRVKGDGRAWQIDLVGFRGKLVLTIDCKHWNTPGYESRFKVAALHQKLATSHLLTMLTEENPDENRGLQALAVILTLTEPPVQFLHHTALVSVEKLPNFLSAVAPFDANVPLISAPAFSVENPMS